MRTKATTSSRQIASSIVCTALLFAVGANGASLSARPSSAKADLRSARASLTRKVKVEDGVPLAFFNSQKADKLPTKHGIDVSTTTPPLLLRPWIHLYQKTPKVLIPGTKLDVAFTLASALVFNVHRLWFGAVPDQPRRVAIPLQEYSGRGGFRRHHIPFHHPRAGTRRCSRHSKV